MTVNLIRTPNHLGDCIMALAALQGLPENINYALMAPQWTEPLYRHLSGAKLHLIPNRHLHGVAAVSRQRPAVKDIQAERGLLLTPSFSSALIFALAKVKHRYGFSSDGRGFLLTDPIDPKNAPEHRADKYRYIMEAFWGIKTRTNIPRLAISSDEITLVTKLLEAGGLSEHTRYVVIAARAVAESRRWGTANYAALATRLIRAFNLKIAVLGTTAEWPAAEEIRGQNPDIANLCGQTDIAIAAAVLSRAALFIGNDSGLAHLAGAAGIPMVVLSGADNPKETSPLASRKTVIIKDHLECISCVKNICPLSGDRHMQCMKQITVDEVFKATTRYLS